jgi:hypothetical protein
VNIFDAVMVRGRHRSKHVGNNRRKRAATFYFA